MSETVIKLENVSKEFRLYDNPITGPIKGMLMPWRRSSYSKEFYAVNNVSMEVKRGEIVGIIGPNGAGKTTLLKMIAGLLSVDKGQISVKGKITALLALGVGVHPEFTGRENIYFGGLLLGMSREEINRKIENIIEFAEIGDFINQPFRTYSSGMKARLLFAISMSIDPDILIVDEALATGDSYFLSKSRNKILDLCRSGATILFVSHNLAQIQELCGRAYFMVKGKLLGEGTPSEMIVEYNSFVFSNQAKKILEKYDSSLQSINGTGDIVVKTINLKNHFDKNETGFYTGESLKIEIIYQSNFKNDKDVDLFIGFLSAKDYGYISEFNSVFYIDSLSNKVERKRLLIKPEGIIEITLNPLLLYNDHYCLWIIFHDQEKGITYSEYKGVSPFFAGGKKYSIGKAAFFWHPGEIKIKEIEL